MIQIASWVDREGRIVRLRVKGHAGAGRFGEDIVCAAVSALVETLAIGLQAYSNPLAGSHWQVKDGDAEFWIQSDADYEAAVAVRWIAAGLKDLSQSHGRFVRWQERESEEQSSEDLR